MTPRGHRFVGAMLLTVIGMYSVVFNCLVCAACFASYDPSASVPTARNNTGTSGAGMDVTQSCAGGQHSAVDGAADVFDAFALALAGHLN